MRSMDLSMMQPMISDIEQSQREAEGLLKILQSLQGMPGMEGFDQSPEYQEMMKGLD